MSTPSTPVVIEPYRDIPSTRLGPGKSAVVLQSSEYNGLPVVPYSPSSCQIEYVNATSDVNFAPSIILCDATVASFTLTLPSAAGYVGRSIKFIKTDVTAATVSFTVMSLDTLWSNGGFASLSKQYECIEFLAISDATSAYGWIALLNKVVV
jgi:hypothetical protein